MSFKHSMGRNNKARCKDGSHLEYEIINVDKGSKDSYMGVQRVVPPWIK
jgi:hypothetical protein